LSAQIESCVFVLLFITAECLFVFVAFNLLLLQGYVKKNAQILRKA